MVTASPWRRLSVLPLLLIAFTTAHADDDGETLAKQGAAGAPPCLTCHGANGEGNAAAGFPRLAGLSAAYQSKQLHDFASGERGNPIMAPIAKALSDQQIEALARYYAGLETASGTVDAPQARLEAGRELAVNGMWSDNLPACIACHGPGARGVGTEFPALAGQHAGYLESQLKAWQTNQRHNDANGLMAAVAAALDDKQIKTVSTYLASLAATGAIPDHAEPDVAPANPDALEGYFQPPLKGDLGDGPFAAAVRRGAAIFNNTHRNPASAPFVGNGQDCSNCHLNGGRQANAAPMWAAWGLYPKYRGKNDKINTMAERLQGCFMFSENAPASEKGHPPAADSALLADLQSYLFWQAQGAPTGATLKGQGYPVLKAPPQPYSAARGKKIFDTHCALCHGDNGQGTPVAGGGYAFPPLWGPQAYNWGAGMHRIETAAGFIKANMPLGKPNSLTNQQAWDLAAYINSHPRPPDPRSEQNLETHIKAYHGTQKRTPLGGLFGEIDPGR